MVFSNCNLLFTWREEPELGRTGFVCWYRVHQPDTANVCVQHIWPAVPGVQIAPSIAAGALDVCKLFTSF